MGIYQDSNALTVKASVFVLNASQEKQFYFGGEAYPVFQYLTETIGHLERTRYKKMQKELDERKMAMLKIAAEQAIRPIVPLFASSSSDYADTETGAYYITEQQKRKVVDVVNDASDFMLPGEESKKLRKMAMDFLQSSLRR